MAALPVTYFLLAVAVFSVTNGMLWARNTKELSNKTMLESEFSPLLEGFRLEKIMLENVGEDGDSVTYMKEPRVRTFQEPPEEIVHPSNIKVSVTTSDGNPVSSVQISPHLVIIYIDLIKRMAVGIILKRRTVLTTCVSTLVWIQRQLFSIKTNVKVICPDCFADSGGGFLQPEYMVILSGVTEDLVGGGRVETIQPINIVAEIRRHPFCGMPFGRGPWMNDMAVLILHAELIQTLSPIQLASENFFTIFSAVQKTISTGEICQAVGIEFRNTTSIFHGASIDVRIVDKSKCGRLCGYMIPQCEPRIGGYFVQFVQNVDRSKMNEWMAEAALVCGGKLYGVVNIFDFACDASLAGLAPKPEAVLHMHISSLKLIANQTSKPPRRSAAAVISSSSSVLVAVATWLSLHEYNAYE